MGLSIHYKGKLRSTQSLEPLIDEVSEIASAFNWQCQEFQRSFSAHRFEQQERIENIYGLSINIPECETIFITFLSNGKLTSPVSLMLFSKPEEKKYLEYISVKTQFAGIEAHKKVIHLFRYLKEKYFQEFELSDEGQYWETRDEKILQTQFHRYNAALNMVAENLQTDPLKYSETFEEYFKKLWEEFRKRNPL